MVCPRCIAMVENVFARLEIPVEKIELGEILPKRALSASEMQSISRGLSEHGFEVIETRTGRIVEDIKRAVNDYLAGIAENGRAKLSTFIAGKIPYDYSYLSDLFSAVEGKSIEQYFIGVRIEKVKELIVYDQLSLTEIAYRTGFSSVHHLSAQFKKITGLTPTHFKAVGAARRKPLDAV